MEGIGDPSMTNHMGSLLVVDDDELNVDILSRRLRKQEYGVDVARDGRSALALIEGRAFDLVLLDVVMPGLDGLGVLEVLRRTHSTTDLPVIMTTAKDKSEDVVAALAMGANDYVTKPLDFPVVLARVATQLSLKRAVAQIRELERGLEERNRALEAAIARMSRDLKAAARVQAALLPQEVPNRPGVSFGWAFRPCDELAGDGLNIVWLDETHVALYVLDVSGHGVASSLLSVSITRVLSSPTDPASILGRHGEGPTNPVDVVLQLNRIFPFDTTTEQYFTLIYGVLNLTTGEFRYVSAGHPGPIHLPAGGAPRLLEGRGFPIGLGLAEDDYAETCVRLDGGDRLYLYSDGVAEAAAPSGEQFGGMRIMNAMERDRSEPLLTAVSALRADVERWCGSAGVHDDISILAVEIGEAIEPRHGERGLDSAKRSGSSA